MAESNYEAMLAQLPLDPPGPDIEGSTDAVGMGRTIERCGNALDMAAMGNSKQPVDEMRQLLRDAKSALTALGFSLDGGDGGWDAATRAAVAQFQEDHDLPCTDHLDSDTYAALMEAYEQALETHADGSDGEDDFMPVPHAREEDTY